MDIFEKIDGHNLNARRSTLGIKNYIEGTVLGLNYVDFFVVGDKYVLVFMQMV